MGTLAALARHGLAYWRSHTYGPFWSPAHRGEVRRRHERSAQLFRDFQVIEQTFYETLPRLEATRLRLEALVARLADQVLDEVPPKVDIDRDEERGRQRPRDPSAVHP